jgi:hypothetical protein
VKYTVSIREEALDCAAGILKDIERISLTEELGGSAV